MSLHGKNQELDQYASQLLSDIKVGKLKCKINRQVFVENQLGLLVKDLQASQKREGHQ
jgi:uncharacterized lipoprotein YajG